MSTVDIPAHQKERQELLYNASFDDLLFKFGDEPCDPALTPQEVELIAAFRAELKEYCEANKEASYVHWMIRSDRVALRFLLARKKDIQKATEMFKEACEFRKAKAIDTNTLKPYPLAAEIFKEYPMTWHKTDKLGRPIYIERSGKIDIKNILKKFDRKDLVDWCWHTNEYTRRIQCPRASVAAGKRIDKTLNILDMSGFSISQVSKLAYSVLQEFSGGAQLLYPEIMGKMYIINCPFMFSGMYAIIKPWIDPRTQEKIVITRGNGLKELLNDVDAENLPDFLGGKCTCPGGCLDNSPEVRSYLELCEKGEPEWRKTQEYLNAAASSASASENGTTNGSH